MAVLTLLRLGALALGRAHQPRLDAELAEAQPLVLIQIDDGPSEPVVVVVTGVLEQVTAELLGERGLVVLEALIVVRGEPGRYSLGTYTRWTDAVLWASISLASLRAISTGCTPELKARLNTPSTRPSMRASRSRRTLIADS